MSKMWWNKDMMHMDMEQGCHIGIQQPIWFFFGKFVPICLSKRLRNFMRFDFRGYRVIQTSVPFLTPISIYGCHLAQPQPI